MRNDVWDLSGRDLDPLWDYQWRIWDDADPLRSMYDDVHAVFPWATARPADFPGLPTRKGRVYQQGLTLCTRPKKEWLDKALPRR